MELIIFSGALIFFIFGLLLGSFFNVLIYRLPKNESIIWPGSHCPNCNHIIKFYENIPVLSYIFLRGKCSGCKSKIPLQYPIVEFTTACLNLVLWYFIAAPYLLEYHNIWDNIFIILQILSVLILIPVSVIDFKHYIIPDSISLGGLVIAIIFSFFPGTITPLEMLFGILAGGGTLFLMGLFGQYVLRKEESMGGGDIKLLAFLGAVWGWEIAFMTILLGACFGSIMGLILIGIKIIDKNKHIPFGPYLSIGFFISIFWGKAIINWYLAFLI
jgi:leader peptidase (prepilin peptidase)/N-methyltransferase